MCFIRNLAPALIESVFVFISFKSSRCDRGDASVAMIEITELQVSQLKAEPLRLIGSISDGGAIEAIKEFSTDLIGMALILVEHDVRLRWPQLSNRDEHKSQCVKQCLSCVERGINRLNLGLS